MTRPDPRQLVAAADAQARSDSATDSSLWALVQSIHRAPVLREFVTLEAQPLCPWVITGTDGAEARIHLLLAVPSVEGPAKLQAPSIYVAWGWPSRRLLAMADVRERLADASGLSREHACRREFTEAVESALRQRSEIPLPPDPIPALVRRALGGSPIAEPPPPQPPYRRSVEKAATGATTTASSGLVLFNLVAELMPRLEAASKLLREVDSPTLEREWQRIYARVGSAHFSVGIVGEPSRGKSTLINRLLGREVLPIERLPKKPRILEVAHSTGRVLEQLPEDDGPSAKPFATEAEVQQTLSEDVSGTRAKVGLPHPWLEATGIRLIEIPSGSDPEDQRLATTIDVLTGCDAVLLIVSASMALSLSERTFVQEYVVGRAIPRLAVVLTHLDVLREDDRREVIRHVHRGIEAWGSDVELLLAQEPASLFATPSVDDAGGPGTILKRLAAWAADPQHRLRVREQVVTNLRSLHSMIRNGLELRRQAALRSQQEKLGELAQEQHRLEARRLDWDEILQGFDQRHLRVQEWFFDELKERSRGLRQGLALQAHRSSDPKLWWERELSYQLQRDLAVLGQSLEKPLARHVVTDSRWLVAEVEKRFGSRIQPLEPEEFIDFEPPPQVSELDLRDLHRLRWLLRGGGIAVSCAAYTLLPLGLFVGGTSMLVGEVVLRKTLERQRETVADSLGALVDPVLDAGMAACRKRLSETYAALAEAVRAQAEDWWSLQREALAGKAPDRKEIGEIERRLVEVDRLTSDLVV